MELCRSYRQSLLALLLVYSALLAIGTKAFSSPYYSAAAWRRNSLSSAPKKEIIRRSITANNPVKGIVRNSVFGHHGRRQLIIAAAGRHATTSTSSSPNKSGSEAAGTKKSKGSNNKDNANANANNKRKNRYNYNNYKKKQQKKQKQQRKKSKNSLSRPYADLTTDELKQLTEYHLSQNIQPYNGTMVSGQMTSAEMHEFSRLISSWSKLDTRINSRRRSDNNNNWSDDASQRQTKILAAEMAEQCLRELIEELEAGNTNAKSIITADMYYLVIRAWIRVGGYKDLVHAGGLLELMEQMHFTFPVNSSSSDSSNNNMKEEMERAKKFMTNSMNCYAAVLDGWCKSKFSGGEVKAEELLTRMGNMNSIVKATGDIGEDGHDGHDGHDARDVKHYNNVMNRIATSGKPMAGAEAERLLNELIASYKYSMSNIDINITRLKKQLAPNRNSFNIVIKAYVNAGGKNSAINAERILNMMENPSTIGLQNLSLQISPDKISYTSILLSYANINKNNNSREGMGSDTGKSGDDGNGGIDAGTRAEELLARMVDLYENGENMDVKPDTVTYNAVLKVWGKTGQHNAGERSKAILNNMLDLYEEGNIDVVPDDVSFNTVIHNIANSNTINSPRRAMQILERMEQSYESGLITAKPDIISYNSVLNAFAKSGGPESARRAEEMLDNLEKSYDSGAWNIRPDVYSYNIVISAWGNGGDANKAVALLDRMTSRSNEGRSNLKPDTTTYNSVLHAWSQSSDRNAPVKALGLLEIMLRLHEGGDRNANPDVLSFSTVINAFSKSKFPRKARQTHDLLRRMKSLCNGGQENMRPNVYVYAAVLNACAYTFGRAEEKEEALKIGIETYEELQRSKDTKTNHVAYGSFVRVCRRLMPNDSDRDDHITRAFRQCCADGQLGEYMLKQLRPMPKLYASLLQEYIVMDRGDNFDVNIEDLPTSWTCNVREGNRRRKSVRRRSGKRK